MSKNDVKFVNQPLPNYEKIFEDNADLEKKAPLKVLADIFKGNWLNIFFIQLIHIADACGEWIFPLATANIINAVTLRENCIPTVLFNFFLAAIAYLMNLPMHAWFQKKANRMLRTIGAGLRNTLVRKLQHLSITYHKEIESGRIQSKFLRDIEAIEFFNSHVIKSLIPIVVNVLVSFYIALSKSPSVAIFFIVVIPVNVFLMTAFRKKIRSTQHTFRHEHETVSASLTTMLEMIPVTKAHGLEEKEIEKLERNFRELKIRGFLLDSTLTRFQSVSYVVSGLLKSSCLLFTSYLAYKGKIPVGDIVLYQSYFTSISAYVQSLFNMYPEFAKGIESVRSVSEIMLSNNIEDDKNKIALRYVHGSIDFENVSFSYANAEKKTINNFSLRVNPGECVAFVGASGSGKSTLMNMIIGFLLPTEGTLKIDGKPIEILNLSSYRSFISVVPQSTVLFKGTIKENILYGIDEISEERFNEILESANINEFLDKLPNGIDTIVGEHGDTLSGGQKQRISIARALIRDPKILILDEATSALDNASEYHVQKAISKLVKGRTTFIVAHRLSTIRNADKIVVMDKGEIVEIGTYDELMEKKGPFYNLKKLNDISATEE